jgi:molybdopterin synthase catalytic subunit
MQERSIGLDAADLQKAHTDEFRKMAGAYVIFGGVVKNCSRR